jgi:hypothetical protein
MQLEEIIDALTDLSDEELDELQAAVIDEIEDRGEGDLEDEDDEG